MGNTFAQLKQGVLVGKYPAVPRAFSYEMSAMIAKMVRVNARERPSVKQILGSDDVKTRKASDWYKEPAAAPAQRDKGSKQQLMDTIHVPSHIRNLQNELPKPCFPDARPNSPEAWPIGADGPRGMTRDDAAQQKAANEANAARKKDPQGPGGRANPSPPATAMPIQPKGSLGELHGNRNNNAPPESQNPYRQPPTNKYAGGYGQPSNRGGPTKAQSAYGGNAAPPRKPLASQASNRNRAAGYNRRSSGYGYR